MILSYIWFPKNLEENVTEKKIERKIKNNFKFNKLFFDITLNSFYLFFSIIAKLN